VKMKWFFALMSFVLLIAGNVLGVITNDPMLALVMIAFAWIFFNQAQIRHLEGKLEKASKEDKQ